MALDLSRVSTEDDDDDDDDGVRATHCGLQQAVVLSEITQLSRATRLHPQVIPVGGVLLWGNNETAPRVNLSH